MNIRQDKHHRWSLDESQVHQYHLGGTLHPGVRWWEAMDVPRRAIQFVEVAELTLVALVCEDLAQNGHVADLIRSVGPTLVITVLLDGPQLSSRWAARYASVLADDPGSAVLTLTSRTAFSRALEGDDLTVLTGWAEAVAEALAHDPERTAAVLADARNRTSGDPRCLHPPPRLRAPRFARPTSPSRKRRSTSSAGA